MPLPDCRTIPALNGRALKASGRLRGHGKEMAGGFQNKRLEPHMLRLVLFLAFSYFVAGAPATHADLTIAKNGHSSYRIVVAPDASPAVQNAANELSADIQQMTGATLPVSNTAGAHNLFVGRSPAALARFSDTQSEAFSPEGFIIRSQNGDLLLEGNDDRGTVYAVYTLLEKYMGARWYAPDATVLPHHGTVRVPEIEDSEAPAFDYRDTDDATVTNQAAWDAHLKLNGVDTPDDPKYGGNYRLFNGDENFYELIPPAKYFATHPEYYSLINGKRDASGGSQLDLTNPDVLKIVTQAAIDWAKANPNALVFGFSPNDAGDGDSQDPQSQASDAKYGAPSGTLLNFVNQVAAGLQAAFPGRKLWVEMLAYQYTQKAPNPGTIAPASNVLVCLAPIFACVAHPLATDPPNKASNDALIAWSHIAPGHLQIWHYTTDFANYLQPLPDWDAIGADMLHYKESGVSGMFCEGDYQNSDAEMQTMRVWVLAHLFWNPHQAVWPLVKDFCDGYYGPAGPNVYAYLRLLHDAIQKPGVHVFIYDPPTSAYFSPDLLKQAEALFDHAQSIAGAAPYRSRVEQARMSLRYVEFEQALKAASAPGADASNLWAQYADLLADIERFHIGYISEGRKTADWQSQTEAALTKLQAPARPPAPSH